MEKKYQVFVSSTYEDLREERQEVIHALLELDCIPSGMELFPAADEDQWSLITEVIDECDYYVLILAGRYGSVGKDDIGYTEQEYRYALEQNKPVIAFLHKDPESLPARSTEESMAGKNRLKAFRRLAEKKMCKYWTDAKDLGSVVSRSLVKLQKSHPGVGWVRGDRVPNEAASTEILRLQKQIEILESELEIARTQAPPGTEDFAQGNDIFKIGFSFMYGHPILGMKRGFDEIDELTWDDIFYFISPLMIQEATDFQLKESLDDVVSRFGLEVLNKKMNDDKVEDIPQFKSFEIDNHDFTTIKVQFRALGLIRESQKNRSVKDTDLYWALTPYGNSVMNRLRAIKKESPADQL